MTVNAARAGSNGTTLIETLAALAVLATVALSIMTAMINSISGRRSDVQQIEIIRQQADDVEVAAMHERAALREPLP